MVYNNYRSQETDQVYFNKNTDPEVELVEFNVPLNT